MKNIDEFVNESAVKYMNKSQLYLLAIPYEMYKEYKQYEEDWKALDEQAIDDLEAMQKFLNSMTEDERVRINYKKLAPQVQEGIKHVCTICLKHKEDLDKLDSRLFQEILDELS